MMMTITMPNAPSGSRRQKCSVARQKDRRSWISSSSGAVIGACTVVVDMMPSPSGEADAWVKPGVEQVDDQIGEHEDRDGEHHQGLGQRVVLVLHRLDEQSADAVEVEDLLGDHKAADQKCELDAD